MKKVRDIFIAVRLGHAFAAMQGDRLTGIVLWNELPDEIALSSIAAQSMPVASQCVAQGPAMVAIAFLAESVDLVRQLWTEFLAAHEGRIILYERHRPGRAAPAVFKWIDKSGRAMGADVDIATNVPM